MCYAVRKGSVDVVQAKLGLHTVRLYIRHVCWHIMHIYIDVSENLLPSTSVQKGHNLKATLYQTTRRHAAQHCLLIQ